MTAVDVSAGTLTAIVVATIPLGAAFLAWVVRELYRTTDINARVAERLDLLDGRVRRIEDAMWRPAWGPPPTTSPPHTITEPDDPDEETS